MAKSNNIFAIENRVDECFDVAYPRRRPHDEPHSTGRRYVPLLGSALGSLVPGAEEGRRLQTNRDYIKVDFLDFIDYATSELPPRPTLHQFPDQSATFYESIPHKSGRLQDSICGKCGEKWPFAIKDAAVARDGIFVTVMMRFGIWPTLSGDTSCHPAEENATITFIVDGISGQRHKLAEWERTYWSPPHPPMDDEWRVLPSGEHTLYELAELENVDQPLVARQHLAQVRKQQSDNYSGVHAEFFEIARLGLHLPSYVEFMYDLVVSDRKRIGTERRPEKNRGRKQRVSSKPSYKIIRSVRIIRPEGSATDVPQFRQWTAPSYSFMVQGHWRHFEDTTRKGHDADGNEVLGKTWVRSYHKYEHKGENVEGESFTRDPRVVIGIKQTLRYARDVIASHSPDSAPQERETPSREWVVTERAKLTAGLRYIILKRDEFRCCKCGKSSVDDNYVRLEVDHKIPVSRWGLTIEENLETLCRECNRGKSDIPDDE